MLKKPSSNEDLQGDAISVVIPVHNEAGSIESLVNEVTSALASFPRWELVVVDDGSCDQTLSLLRALQTTQPALRVIEHRGNRGQSRAIRTGVLFARYPVIALLDGDGQNDPADIPALYRQLRPGDDVGFDLVQGHRVLRQDSRWKLFSSRLANGVRRALLRDATPDSGCGIKLIRRQTFRQLPYFDHMHRFMPALVLGCGGRVTSVAVNHRPRRFDSSHYGSLDRLLAGVVDLVGVAWLLHRQRPVETVELAAPAEKTASMQRRQRA